MAYNFAGRLKTLKGKSPYEFVRAVWAIEPERFHVDPSHFTVGLNITEASLCTGSEEVIRAPGFYRHLGWVDSGFMDDGQLKFCKTLS